MSGKSTKKLTLEFVTNKFIERGLILLETEYKNANTNMRYICLKHEDKGVQQITYGSFYTGSGCKHCGRERTVKSRKLSYVYIWAEFAKRGYLLLETEYINSQTKMRYICSKHNFEIQSITYGNLQSKKGCYYCSGRRHLSIKLIAEEFEQRGYTLLETNYINSRQKLKYTCKLHPNEQQSITYGDFHSGSGCRFCGNENTAKSQKLSIDYMSKKLEESDCLLIHKQDIENCSQKIKFICNKHPNIIQESFFHNIINGHGCKYCRIDKNTGENHSNWKGGITPLHNYLRQRIGDWKYKSLVASDFKCMFTGENNGNLVVHHLLGFNLILKKVMEELDLPIYQEISKYSIEELYNIENIIVHEHNKLLGVCLNPDIHELFHNEYGRGSNTPEQWNKFVEKYKEMI